MLHGISQYCSSQYTISSTLIIFLVLLTLQSTTKPPSNQHLFLAQQPPVGQGLLIHEVSRSQVINISTEFPKHRQPFKILDSHSDVDESSLLGYNAMSYAKYLPISLSRSSETSNYLPINMAS